MADLTRTCITGYGLPLKDNDVDTDRIIPARYLMTVVFDGLGDHVFEDDRRQLTHEGKCHPFDDPRFRKAKILVVNKNFGCGSSREHAPQAIMRWGIEAIIGESFAEIFFGNCLMIGIPCVTAKDTEIAALQELLEAKPDAEVCLNIEAQTILADRKYYTAGIPSGARSQFLEGTWDSTAELLEGATLVAAKAKSLSYFCGYIK